MSFVVEDGTSKSDATSYSTVAQADAYLAVFTTRTGWDSASDSEKEIALQRSTQYLDNLYGARYKGIRTDEDQALMWPRTGATDLSGYSYDSDQMPACLLHATAEAADRFIAGDNPMADQEDASKIKRQKVKAGPIEEETEFVGGMTLGKQYPVIDSILKPLLSSTGNVKLMRA